jgi:hypothetical protein
MPEFCNYRNCHNLASSSFQGYCNQQHFEKGFEDDILYKILEKNPHILTLRDARLYLAALKKGAGSEKKRDE